MSESDPREDEQAWRDWQRVEDCIWFGVTRWNYTIMALAVAWYGLRPISDWLFAGALFGILWAHHAWTKRADARRLQELVNIYAGLEPPSPTTIRQHWSGVTSAEHWQAVIVAAFATWAVLAWWKGWLTLKL